MKLLFAAAEIYPYAKTGGLADVAQALPKALSETIEVRTIMPLYRFVNRKKFTISNLKKAFYVILGEKRYRISLYSGDNQGVETLFVYNKILCDRDAPYGDENSAYPDNDIRFAIFSKAVVKAAQVYGVDILHLNDWHTALAALWARESLPYFRTLFTIHNLAFQGIFPYESLARMGLNKSYFTPDGIEFWGEANLMKAAIAYSDMVTTVSPRYAQEILHPEFGFGLDGFLGEYRHKLYGILNGIDTNLFDPEQDPALPHHYNSSSLRGKKENKASYCASHHFEPSRYPLFVFIGRFTQQKGLHIIIDALSELLKNKLHISILGEGDPNMAAELEVIAQQNDHLSLFFGYDESISHQMYAAADFLLMPSSFEPCGLNQLIALHYGTIPIVHRVGGLYDTVEDMDDRSPAICGRGIAIKSYDTRGLIEAVERALYLYDDSETFEHIATANMKCDVSFQNSAKEYLAHYSSLLA